MKLHQQFEWSGRVYRIEQRQEDLHGLEFGIRYHLDFSDAGRHRIGISIEIDDPGRSPVLVMPAWVPGSYKIRDYVSFQSNVTVETSSGEPVESNWFGTNRLRVDNPDEGSIVVRYHYFAFERSVRHSHVTRNHAFLHPGSFLMYVDGRTSEPHSVAVSAEWDSISTSLHPVDDSGDRPTFGAINFDVLIDSPFELGDHDVVSFVVDDIPHDIVIAPEGNVDRAWLRSVCRTVVETGRDFWGELPYERYTFFLQFVPGKYGGLEHAVSQVSTFDPTTLSKPASRRRFLALLTHEFFHTWNVKRIRPIEYGPFDLSREAHSTMLWLAEGATSYFDDLLSLRSGFQTEEEYLTTIAEERIGRLLQVPGRHQLTIEESSFLAWVKLYNPHADSINLYPSYYLKGGVLFLLLDLLVISGSDGRSTLRDGMLRLWERYLEQPETGLTTDEFLDLVVESTGVDVRDQFLTWIRSTEDPDYNALLGTVGLRLEWQEETGEEGGDSTDYPESRTPKIGASYTFADRAVVIDAVRDGDPAADAGIGAGDRVLAIDGFAIASAADFESRTGRTDGSQIWTIESDGQVAQVEVTPRPSRKARLVDVSDRLTDAQQSLRNVWLTGVVVSEHEPTDAA